MICLRHTPSRMPVSELPSLRVTPPLWAEHNRTEENYIKPESVIESHWINWSTRCTRRNSTCLLVDLTEHQTRAITHRRKTYYKINITNIIIPSFRTSWAPTINNNARILRDRIFIAHSSQGVAHPPSFNVQTHCQYSTLRILWWFTIWRIVHNSQSGKYISFLFDRLSALRCDFRCLLSKLFESERTLPRTSEQSKPK